MISFAQLGSALAVAAVQVEHSAATSMGKACQLLEDSAKHAIGTYEFDWPQLADATQEQRVSLGFSANEPLLRTGELKNSIEHKVSSDGKDGWVGTDVPYAKYHEFGTSKIPARPFLGGALAQNEEKIKDIFGHGAHVAISHE